MLINVEKRRGITVVALEGRLTSGHAEATVRDHFKALLSAGDRRFVFDLSKVPYLDSAGVGELVACAKRVGEQGGVIKVAGARDATARIFEITCLDRVFDLHPSRSEAVASF